MQVIIEALLRSQHPPQVLTPCFPGLQLAPGAGNLASPGSLPVAIPGVLDPQSWSRKEGGPRRAAGPIGLTWCPACTDFWIVDCSAS
jgi:hypothetical protein